MMSFTDPIVKRSSIQMVVCKPDRKIPGFGPKCPVLAWAAKSRDFTIWILDTHTVQYSGVQYLDGYCI